MKERVLVLLEKIGGYYHPLSLAFGKWSLSENESGQIVAERDLSELGIVSKKDEK